MPADTTDILDLFIIGGGINGCGIARDAAGRGLTVALADQADLASATSSASTKLFHGGLRYLEFFKFRLVRESLEEREVLLRAMPHISWPMRFILPLNPDMRFDTSTPAARLMPWLKGRRPAWMIRLGLFLYDTLGGRKILPGTTTLSLQGTPEGGPLKPELTRAFEYSDCWVDDARLVVLNARDAGLRGAQILTRSRVTSATRHADHWQIAVTNAATRTTTTHRARILVNAAGPWAGDILRDVVRLNTPQKVRLVRGSHIVTKRLFDHDKAYFLQGSDGRIIFAIPYEQDFTLIGTTDVDHADPDTKPAITEDETTYLCDFASRYFATPITPDAVVWTYSGVRPLYDDGASSATSATRDYVLSLDDAAGAPLLSVFGGKITTYRRLAESALAKLSPHVPQMSKSWTAGAPLPGGDFPVDGVTDLTDALQQAHPFLDQGHAARLVRAYGTEARAVLRGAATAADLGQDFGATLTEVEIRWLMAHEFARTAADVVWRRSKLGLRMTPDQIKTLDDWMNSQPNGQTGAPAAA